VTHTLKQVMKQDDMIEDKNVQALVDWHLFKGGLSLQ